MYKLFQIAGIALCALIFIFTAPSYAQSSLFTVKGVEVDVTAESALKAKEQAFREAQITAFKTLLSRMITDSEIALLTPGDYARVSSLIQDFEITDEKLSKVRYIGEYTFRFKEKETRDFFNASGFGFSDVRGDPILVLPLYRDDYKTVLWSYDNEWLRAWNRVGSLEGLVPTTVPIGDLADVNDLGDDDALSYTKDALRNLLERYQAGEAVIAIAMPEKPLENDGAIDKSKATPVKIQIFRTDTTTPEFVREITVTPDENDERKDVFDDAVKQVHKALQRDWKVKTRVTMNETNEIVVRVPIKNIKEWADTQKAIRNVSAINAFKVRKLSSNEALIDIKFQGHASRLQAVLRDFDMTLNMPKKQKKDEGRLFGFASTEEPEIYELYLNKYQPNSTTN